jgi:hypothetical protein
LFPEPVPLKTPSFEDELAKFNAFGTETRLTQRAWHPGSMEQMPVFENEFWTAKQRDCHSLHEISYRACFKPQLPNFFIQRFTRPGDVVYDPFMGRGTTLLEAALHGRIPFGCDVNPLSKSLLGPRLHPPTLDEVQKRLHSIDLGQASEWREDILVFYHPNTLRQIISLKEYLLRREASGELDHVDDWIRCVAINRLTGHSNGFFSVYTLPPNQAVSIKSQIRINAKRNQTPEERDVKAIILKKSRSLLKDLKETDRLQLIRLSKKALLLSQLSASTPQIPAQSVSLVVTSPPFLDIVDYHGDNWLRCWFCGIDARKVQITKLKKPEAWSEAMTEVFRELHRVLKPGGHVAFEVGEVRLGKVKLEDSVIPCGIEAGLDPELVLINTQEFTKTANCWGVDNNSLGTNSNRIVLFKKGADPKRSL